MLKSARILKSVQLVVGLLLFWFLLPAPVTLVGSFDVSLPPGVLDGDDDDDAIATLSDLDLKVLGMIPAPPSDLRKPVEGFAPVQRFDSPFSISGPSTLSRSPPLS